MRKAKAVRRAFDPSSRPTPRWLLEREVAFLADERDALGKVHGEQLASIVQSECAVGTDLLGLESYNPLVFSYRFKVRDNLKNKLMRLARERRQLLAAHHKDIVTVSAHDLNFPNPILIPNGEYIPPARRQC